MGGEGAEAFLGRIAAGEVTAVKVDGYSIFVAGDGCLGRMRTDQKAYVATLRSGRTIEVDYCFSLRSCEP